METPTDFLRFVTGTAEDAVQFDGDEFELAHRARNGDVTAVAELSSAYRAIAVLTGRADAAAMAASARRCARGDART